MKIACVYDRPLHTSGISIHSQHLSHQLNLKGIESFFFDSKLLFQKELNSFSHVFLNWDFNDTPRYESFIEEVDHYRQSGVIPLIFVHSAFLSQDKALAELKAMSVKIVTHSADISTFYKIPYIDLGIEVINFKKLPKNKNCIGTFGYFASYKNYEKVIDICKNTNSMFLCNLSSDSDDQIDSVCHYLKQICTKNGVKSVINSGFIDYSSLLSFLSQANLLLFLRDNPHDNQLVGSSSSSARIAMNIGVPVFCDNESLFFNDLKKYATVTDRSRLIYEINKTLNEESHYSNLAKKTAACLDELRWERVIDSYIDILTQD
jgi:glycosyltransferase involved in cell wall biosynthesis